MKRLSGYSILILLLSSILVFDGCKRGDDDPFFSFRSRKARVTGDWAFDTFDSKVTQYFSNPDYQAVITFKLASDRITIKTDSINTPHDTSKTLTGIIKEAYYNFDKNSKMRYLFHYQLTWEKTVTDENTNITTYDKVVTTVKEEASGSWNFLSNVEKNAVEKYKNKERISLVFENFQTKIDVVTTQKVTDQDGNQLPANPYTFTTESHANTYANGENAQIWVLRELRNKKIVMEHVIDNATVSNDNGVGYSFYEKGEESCILIPRQDN